MFIYGGCRGNKNNYLFEEHCWSQCTGDGGNLSPFPDSWHALPPHLPRSNVIWKSPCFPRTTPKRAAGTPDHSSPNSPLFTGSSLSSLGFRGNRRARRRRCTPSPPVRTLQLLHQRCVASPQLRPQGPPRGKWDLPLHLGFVASSIQEGPGFSGASWQGCPWCCWYNSSTAALLRREGLLTPSSCYCHSFSREGNPIMRVFSSVHHPRLESSHSG